MYHIKRLKEYLNCWDFYLQFSKIKYNFSTLNLQANVQCLKCFLYLENKEATFRIPHCWDPPRRLCQAGGLYCPLLATGGDLLQQI